MALRKPFGAVGVRRQVGEGDLRLDHPELGQMARRVGVLGAEGGAESVDLAHRQAVGLHVELAGDGEERLATEEVLAEVDRALVVARQVGQVQGRQTEHVAGALGVGGGDDRGVDPEKALLGQVPVDRHHHGVAHAGDRTEQIGAWTQVGDLAQELHRVLLGLDRVGFRVIDQAGHGDLLGLNLERLALALRRHQGAADDHAGAGGQVLDLAVVIVQRGRHHRLDRCKAGAIGDVHERQPGLGVAPGTDPTAHGHLLAGLDRAGKRLLDAAYGRADHRHGLKLLLGRHI